VQDQKNILIEFSSKKVLSELDLMVYTIAEKIDRMTEKIDKLINSVNSIAHTVNEITKQRKIET